MQYPHRFIVESMVTRGGISDVLETWFADYHLFI